MENTLALINQLNRQVERMTCDVMLIEINSLTVRRETLLFSVEGSSHCIHIYSLTNLW